MARISQGVSPERVVAAYEALYAGLRSSIRS